MATHRIGPQTGRLILRTTRQGLAAQAGHDLTIEITSWSGEVELADDPAESSLTVTMQTGSLEVVEGTGGIKPLSERDKREIAGTIRKLLDTDRQPEATYRSTRVVADGNGAGTIEGELTLRGRTNPMRIEVTSTGEQHYRGTATVVQTEFGIKPYVGFLGALKVSDPVGVEAEVGLSEVPGPVADGTVPAFRRDGGRGRENAGLRRPAGEKRKSRRSISPGRSARWCVDL